jgi:hypothetical protein
MGKKRSNRTKKKTGYTPEEIAEFNRLHDLRNPNPLSGCAYQTVYVPTQAPVSAQRSNFFKGK